MSEDLIRAARMMQAAADTIEQAVRHLSGALEQHQRFMDDWLHRKQNPPASPEPAIDPNNPDEIAWREWKGGFSPVPNEAMVWVRLRNHVVLRSAAEHINWRHYRQEESSDVMAWQPVR